MRNRLLIPAVLALLLSAMTGGLRAEDLNGIWKGTLSQGPGGCYPNYFLELHITVNGNHQITGKAYDYYDKTHFVKMSFTGRYNARTHRLVLIEDKILAAEIPPDCLPCVKTYDLNYSKTGEVEELTGDWKGLYSEKHLVCPPGKIRLRRSNVSEFPADVEQSDTLTRLQAILHLQPREKQVVRTVTVGNPDIKIELYDNAEIDHDTVTVLINDKLLLYRQMLTDRPLKLSEDDYLVYTFNRFEACRFGLEGTCVNPQTGERRTIAEDILDTLDRIAPHAAALGSRAALDEIGALAKARVNDASWLRTVFKQEKSLNETVRQQCLRWRE